MKSYQYKYYNCIFSAIVCCENNQDWNVINIYPTGSDKEVCVVYYIETNLKKHLEDEV